MDWSVVRQRVGRGRWDSVLRWSATHRELRARQGTRKDYEESWIRTDGVAADSCHYGRLRQRNRCNGWIESAESVGQERVSAYRFFGVDAR